MNKSRPDWNRLTEDRGSFPPLGQSCVVTVCGEHKTFDYETCEQKGKTEYVTEYLDADFNENGCFEIYFDCLNDIYNLLLLESNEGETRWNGIFKPYQNHISFQNVYHSDNYGFKSIKTLEQAEITITAWYAVPNETYDEKDTLLNSAPLKRCPFCGGKAEIVFRGQKQPFWKGYIVAKCEVCGASSRGSYYEGDEIKIPLRATEGAFKETGRWNTRKKV